MIGKTYCCWSSELKSAITYYFYHRFIPSRLVMDISPVHDTKLFIAHSVIGFSTEAKLLRGYCIGPANYAQIIFISFIFKSGDRLSNTASSSTLLHK